MLEAATYGKPVVASGSRDGAGILLPGRTGFLLDDARPERIAAALRELIADAELRARLGSAALEHARERFDPVRNARAVEAVYDELLGLEPEPAARAARRARRGLMCGLCGVVALGRPPETETVRRMAAALDHRGPDGDGSFADDGVALGFRRLAIIDLSDAGMQPFASDDGALQLRAQRRDLQLPRAAPRARGARPSLPLADRHRGDRPRVRGVGRRLRARASTACGRSRSGTAARQRLFCSRDRFGVKPFYYSWDGGRFAFASELKAFRAAGPLEPHLPAVRDFLEQGYVDHTDDTFFAGIRKLPPAHSLVVDERGLRLSRYWELEPRDVDGDSADAVRELFLDAVRLRLRSDVPVGTCLSGGIDSSAIVCAVDHLLRTEAENARPVGDRQRTFTAFFEERGFDERPFAEAVVAQTRSQPHWVTFDSRELVDVLPSIVRTQDEPFGSTSIVAQWFVMRAAKEAGLKVMLDGQGADETLAGYHGYFGPFFADLLRSGQLRELGAELRAYRGRPRRRRRHDRRVALARPFLPERVRWAARGRVRGGSALVHPDLPRTQPCRTSTASTAATCAGRCS